MNGLSLVKKLTVAASIIIGVCCGFLLSATTHEHHVQYWLLGFVIGFPIIWIIYLAVWFIIKGVSKTPFPAQSRSIVNGIKRLFNATFTEYQETMLVDMTGTVLLIATALAIAGAVLVVITGVLFILGRLSW